jgi:hypothetical protein
MTVNKAYLIIRYPEFATTDATRIDTLAADAALEMSVSKWGSKYDRGLAALVAHMIKVADQAASGAAGPVTSEKIGDLSRSYGQVGGTTGDELLMTTAYGQEYLRLRRQLVAGPRVT